MARVLKPGGRLLVLEFSKPRNPLLTRAYDEYSFRLLPLMGRMVAGDPDSYRYLAERSEEHTSELQSRPHLVCRLLLEKKKRAGATSRTGPRSRRAGNPAPLALLPARAGVTCRIASDTGIRLRASRCMPGSGLVWARSW